MTQIEQDLKYQDEKLLGELSIDNATAIQIGQNGVIDPGMFVGGSTGSVATPTTPTVPAFWSQVHSPPGYTMSIDTAGQDINNAAVVLAWPSNNGSDSTSPENVVAYQIRWKKTSASDYHYEMVPGSGNLSGINMSKLIKGLAQNVSYDFAIQAINSIGNVSGWSSTTTATTANATAPATPTNFKVYKAPRGAALEWTANGETDLLGYQCEYLPQLGAGWANGATVTTITLLTPLAILVPIGTTITVTDGGANSQNFVTVTNIGQPGDLTLTVTSATATFSTITFANFWVNCGQLIVNNALVTGIPLVLPSNANLVGLNLIFRLRAINNSLQVSAWTSNSAAVPIDGNYFDELLAGNLKVFGVLTTTGGLRTSASGARAIVGPNPNNTAQLGFFIHDGGATDWSDATHANISPVFGAGIVFGARHDGTVFVKGTVYASIVNASVFIGSGTTPTYTAPTTGFAIDPTNGFRWFSASVLVAQWSPNGTLTINSGASIYGATVATSSVVGTGASGGGGYKLSGNQIDFYTSGINVSGYSSSGFWNNSDAGGSGSTTWTKRAEIKFGVAEGPDASATWADAGAIQLTAMADIRLYPGTTPGSETATGGKGDVVIFHGGLRPDINNARNLVPVLIAKTSLGAAAASVVFSSIPAGFTDLEIRSVAQTDNAAAQLYALRFNADTGNNYYSNIHVYTNANSVNEYLGTSRIIVGTLSSSGVTSNRSVCMVRIFSYADGSKVHQVLSESHRLDGGATGQLLGTNGGGEWTSTAAITSVTVLADAGNLTAGSVFELWGIP